MRREGEGRKVEERGKRGGAKRERERIEGEEERRNK